jgi:hypothetical protein
MCSLVQQVQALPDLRLPPEIHSSKFFTSSAKYTPFKWHLILNALVQSLGIESQQGYWYEVSFKARGMKTKRAGNIKHQAYGKRRTVSEGLQQHAGSCGRLQSYRLS